MYFAVSEIDFAFSKKTVVTVVATVFFCSLVSLVHLVFCINYYIVKHITEVLATCVIALASKQAVGWSKKTEFVMRSPSWIRAARSRPG